MDTLAGEWAAVKARKTHDAEHSKLAKAREEQEAEGRGLES